ncbi:basic proline-rich protein-like [Moschus berezovskii]|uniref:basic proline-rich protein-like n=1 Tax=Moschus berezovskii TaxID=68408 RepID=UPI002443AEF4|nr:basic proline-rich protein-like [Moschus berezovskii]
MPSHSAERSAVLPHEYLTLTSSHKIGGLAAGRGPGGLWARSPSLRRAPGARGSRPPGTPAPAPAAAILGRSPRRASARGPGDSAAGRVRPRARSRAGLRAGLRLRDRRCGDAGAGSPGRAGGRRISQRGWGSPGSRPRARAPAPARARPPGSPRVPTHGTQARHSPLPRAAARAALRTCSAPPPPPPEAPLPPRRPRAPPPPPPPGARPRSASPCAATRPGGRGAPSLSLRSGRSLRLVQERKRCARAFASASVRNSQVHPRGGAGLCSGQCLRSHFGFQETASFT